MDKVLGLLIGRVLALVLLATVVLAAPVAASTSAVSLLGSAEPGPGASATLTLENGNGLQAIVSVRVQAPAGKTIDTASLAGQSCDLVEGQAVCGPWAAHETLQMTVHSPQGLSPADGPFRAFASSDGQTYSGPFLIDWLLPCRCADRYLDEGEGCVHGPVRAVAYRSQTREVRRTRYLADQMQHWPRRLFG